MKYRILLSLLIAIPTSLAICLGFHLSPVMGLLVGLSVGGVSSILVMAATR